MRAGFWMTATMAIALGATGGVALGGYATGQPVSLDPSSSAYASVGSDIAAPVDTGLAEPEMAAPTDGPTDYVCHGCGPTLAERRMRDMGWDGYADPLPAAYEAAPADDEGTLL